MIDTLLRLSQGHLSPSTRSDWLEPGALLAYDLGGSNWLIPVVDNLPSDLPGDLAECVALARSNSCDWIMFDAATPPLSILPVHQHSPEIS